MIGILSKGWGAGGEAVLTKCEKELGKCPRKETSCGRNQSGGNVELRGEKKKRKKRERKWHLATAGLPTDNDGLRCKPQATNIPRYMNA